MSGRPQRSALARTWRRHRGSVAAWAVAVAVSAGAAGALAVIAARRGGMGWVAVAVAAGAAGWGIVRLVRAAQRPARDLTRFLEGIRYDDASVRIPTGGGGALREGLAAAFADVGAAFERVRAEREEQAAYLEAVVRHVGVALVAFRDDGVVTLFNPAAGRALGVARPRSLDALAQRAPAAAQALVGLRAGSRALVRLEHDAGTQELVAYATQFSLGGRTHTLASLQDIRAELEARELDAWERLTRVLTHEITNSVAPIASLAGTARGLADEGDLGAVDEALETIERRSRGLVSFVEAYRTLAGVPQPTPRVVPAADLAGRVATLFRTTAAERGVAVSVAVEPARLEMVVDPDLVEQALVNVVLNAIEATGAAGGGTVAIRVSTGPGGRPIVAVADDGPGIESDVLERVAVPFFSTKPGGSGIGLALARRVVRLHGGELAVVSEPGGGATVELRF
ncbi:sensor histidine kinase [Rubrivirga sp. IMCC45206]|uniref:sensor histidine kinase n=1 Tax=Rubrivirga sp. IMCC45206 TaxID=3391614 RepID=UPI0039901200